jgi:RNA polymerase sigma-70 factor, ECF subfamily
MIDWEKILKRDGPSAWKSAWRVLGNRADTDECYQEACVAALEVSRREKVGNWRFLLQGLATTKAIDRLRVKIRRRPREQTLPEDALAAGDNPPGDQLENAELVAKLRVALGELPSRQAEAFCLFYFDEWSYREIAENLAISTDLVGVWLERARDRLRGLLVSGDQSRDESWRGVQ